jgi:hypothetical protein
MATGVPLCSTSSESLPKGRSVAGATAKAQARRWVSAVRDGAKTPIHLPRLGPGSATSRQGLTAGGVRGASYAVGPSGLWAPDLLHRSGTGGGSRTVLA